MISGLSLSAAACNAATSSTAKNALSSFRNPIFARLSSCSMLILDRPDRILPQLHLQAPLPDPQAVRAQLRAGALAADGAQDLRDLRPAAAPQNGWQACHGNRADRARPSRLPCLLQARGPEAVREVLDIPAQRALLQQSQGLRSQEELGQPASGPGKVPDHHQLLREAVP